MFVFPNTGVLTAFTATYAAFCNQYGYHCTKAVGSHNWNEEAISVMVSSLQPKWRQLYKEFASQSRNAMTLTEDILDELKTLLGNQGLWSVFHEGVSLTMNQSPMES